MTPGQRFSVGDEVNVFGDHPHRGESGTIARAADVPGFDWVVDFSAAYSGSAYVSERNLRRLDR